MMCLFILLLLLISTIIPSITSQAILSKPVIWSIKGNINQTTQGGGVITLTGEYFKPNISLCPSAFSTPPLVKFTYDSDSGTLGSQAGGYSLCTVNLTSWTQNSLTCSIPTGTGIPHVTIETCNSAAISADLPDWPSDVFFWPDANVPVDSSYCINTISDTTGNLTEWVNTYFCSSDTKAKLWNRPIFTWSINGPVAGKNCTQITSTPSAGWQKTYLCTESQSLYKGLQWSQAGPINGMDCVLWQNPYSSSSVWKGSSSFLCAPSSVPYQGTDIDLRYHYQQPLINNISPASANTAGGSLLTIYGLSFGFIDTTAVTINSILTTVNSVNHTQIVVVLPSGQGTVSIIVTVSGISSVAYSWSYASPVLYSLSPTAIDWNTTGSQILTIQGRNFGFVDSLVTVQFGVASNSFCAVLFANDTYLKCSTPAGQGYNIPIYVYSNAVQSVSPLLLNYSSPTLISITPTIADAGGGTIITISGYNLGQSGSVMIGPNLCPLVNNGWASNAIQCSLPAGTGTNQAVVVSVAGLSANNIYFSYNRPNVTSVNPIGAAAGSGQLLTIAGASFGTSGTITIAGQVCLVSSSVSASLYSNNRIICQVPAVGSGLFQNLSVAVASQVSNNIAFSFSPVINSVAPLTGTLIPTAGGVTVNITGLGFSTPAIAAPIIFIGGNLCNVTDQKDNQILCTLPPGQGVTEVVAQVTVFSSSSSLILQSLTASLTYNPPVITALSPTKGNTTGGTLITLQGTNFGSLSSVTVNAFICSFVSSNHTAHICSTPPGTGTNLLVILTSSSVSVYAASNFSYSPPLITSVSPSRGSSQGGFLITLNGYNFGQFTAYNVYSSTGSAQALITVTAFPTGVNSGIIPTYQNHTQLIFLMPNPGGVGPTNILVDVDGQVNSTDSFTYDQSIISSISPSVGATAGGITLVITGTSFGSNGYVTVGGSQAVLTGSGYNDTRIEVILPAGQGTAAVIVTSGVQSSPALYFNYSSPNITSISINNGPTTGGGLLTIQGNNFGQTGTVFIGSIICPTDQPGAFYSDAIIICVPQPGIGANQFLYVVAGNVQTNSLSYSYNAPVISAVSPQQGLSVGGDILTITGINFGPQGSQTSQSVFIGSTVNSAQCILTNVAISDHDTIYCTTPANYGSNLILTLSVAGQNATSSFSYNPPTVVAISPSVVSSTLGQDMLTVYGSNFGSSSMAGLSSSSSLTVGSLAVPILFQNDSTIKFRAPAGTGFNIPINLTVAGQNNIQPYSIVFSYPAPIITGLNAVEMLASTNGACVNTAQSFAANCPPDIGLNITLYGSNFGTDITKISLLLDPTAIPPGSCTPFYANHTVLRCSLGNTTFGSGYKIGGSGLSAALTVNSQSSTAVSLLSFAGPVLTPASLRVNYSTSTTSINIPVTAGAASIVLPRLDIGAANLALTAWFDGSSLGASYTNPIIQYAAFDSATASSLAAGPFNCINPRVTAANNANTSSLTDSSGNDQCTAGTCTRVRCRLSISAGSWWRFRYQTSLGEWSTWTSDYLSFASPLIYTNTLFANTNATIGKYAQDQIIFQAVGLGNNITSLAQYATVQYIGNSAPYNTSYYQCTNVKFTSNKVNGIYYNTTVTCTAQNLPNPYSTCSAVGGSIAKFNFQIIMINSPSPLTTDTYTPASAPTITGVTVNNVNNADQKKCFQSIYPPGATLANGGYNVAVNCPTLQGSTVTITGCGFTKSDTAGTTPNLVYIGSTKCFSVRALDTTQLMCNMSQDSGLYKNVTVTASSIVNTPLSNVLAFGVSFRGPTAESVPGGCATSSSTSGQAFDCDRAGNANIVIKGYNWGPYQPIVSVGGIACPATVQAQAPDSQGLYATQCTLPAGTGLNVPICIQQGAESGYIGNSSTSCPTLINYEQCTAGYAAPSGQVVCDVCPAGKYTDGISYTSCVDCAAGYYNTPAMTAETQLEWSQSIVAATQMTNDLTTQFTFADGSTGFSSWARNTLNGHTNSDYTTAGNSGSRTRYDKTLWKWWQLQMNLTTTFDFSNYDYFYVYNVTIWPRTDSNALTDSSASPACCGWYNGLQIWVGNTTQKGEDQGVYPAQSFGAPQGVTNPNFQPIPGWKMCQNNTVIKAGGSSIQCNGSVFGTYLAVVLPNYGGLNVSLQIARLTVTVKVFKSSAFSSCKPCSQGQFTPSTGSTTCSSCSAGTYAPIGGSASCTACDAGTFSTAEGASACSLCTPGTFSGSSSSTRCSACSPGTYSETYAAQLCLACPAGTYAPIPPTGATSGATNCTNCGAGTFSAFDGSLSCTSCQPGYYSFAARLPQCLPCDAGTYSNATAASGCYTCPAGQYSIKSGSQGATACISCTSGKYNPLSAQSTCIGCDRGQYNSGPALTSCSRCSPGNWQNVQSATSCFTCPPGKFTQFNGTVRCVDCAAGTYQDQYGASSCLPCQIGKTQPFLGQTVCQSCDLGTYMPTTGQAACLPCDSGYFGNSSLLTNCYSCVAGRYSTKAINSPVGPTSCSDCGVGSFSFSGQGFCSQCPAGSYQDQTAQSSCQSCLIGTANQQSGQSSCSQCTPGYYSDTVGGYSCQQCPVGKITSSFGATNCSACPLSTYNPNSGSSVCYNCPAGTFNAALGQGACADCPIGTFSNGGNNVSSCAACPVGKYQPKTGQSSCVNCPIGTYLAATGQAVCAACPAGYFGSNTGSTVCNLCPVGSASSNTGVTSCAQCSAGYYSSVQGSIVCNPCDVGTYNKVNNATTCSPCDVGKYSQSQGSRLCANCPLGKSTNSLGTIQCYACDTGSYAAARGLALCSPCLEATYQDSTGSTVCKLCPAGSYTASQSSKVCQPCPAGTYSFGNVSQCLGCSTGSYQDTTGATNCKACAVGSFASGTAQSKCTQCPAGSFSNSTFGTNCTKCPAGSQQPLSGQASCVKCTPGTFSLNAGSSSCASCAPGSFNNVTGAFNCTQCAAGSFTASASSLSCQSCAVGKYTLQPGQQSCSSCLPGSYLNFTGANRVCDSCPVSTYQSLSGQSRCQPCSVGYFTTTTSQASCVACPAGSYNMLNGSTTCISCSQGSYQPSNGQSSCLACGAGTYSNLVAQSVCTLCDVVTLIT
jgi:hypothetical protein